MADHFDERVSSDPLLLRIGGWGTAAAVALGAFAFSAQSDAGSKRLQLALNGAMDETAYPVAVAAPAKPDPAVKLLQAKLDRLDTERVRIDARLTTLEHGLDDVTGSIRRQAEAPAAAKAQEPRPFIEPPVIPKVETLPSASTAKVAAIAPATSQQTVPAGPEAQAAAASVPVLTEVPMPRARPKHQHPTHAEYGIELGTAPDMEALRVRWTAIKANFGPMLVGMSPIGIKDRHPGSTQLRLVAGPVKNLSAARELCGRIVAGKGYCWPMRVDATDVVMR